MELDFGDAIRALKEGKRVAREGWNGKGMYLEYVDNAEFQDKGKWFIPLLPFIVMFTAQGELVPWLASQTDMLAEDWEVV